MNINQKIYLGLTLMFATFLLTGCGSKNIDKNIVDHAVVQGEIQQKIDDLESQKLDLSFPSWLSKLNIFEPEGLDLDKTKSYKTTKKIEGFDSIHFVYNGEYNKSMSQAKRIANKANISVSAEFQMAQDIIKNVDFRNIQMQQVMSEFAGDMKGIIYTNYDLMGGNNVEYMIAVTVNESGSLEIDVTDMIAMQEIADQYTIL